MKLHQLRVMLAICERIRAGETLDQIAASGEVTLRSGRKIKLPHVATIYRWIKKKEFEPIYREAFDWATDLMERKSMDIADDVAKKVEGRFPMAEVAAARLGSSICAGGCQCATGPSTATAHRLPSITSLPRTQLRSSSRMKDARN